MMLLLAAILILLLIAVILLNACFSLLGDVKFLARKQWEEQEATNVLLRELLGRISYKS